MGQSEGRNQNAMESIPKKDEVWGNGRVVFKGKEEWWECSRWVETCSFRSVQCFGSATTVD